MFVTDYSHMSVWDENRRPKRDQQSLSLLVVDHEERVARVIRAIFERSGHTVTVASTLAGATRNLMNGLVPDAAIVDSVLADGDGLTYASRLGAGHGIGVVVMNGGLLELSGPRHVQILAKPFTPDQLEDSVQRCLANRLADLAA